MSSKDETNAAMPQRIDLTQFEGMTKGSWKYRDMFNEKQTEWDLWSYDENGDPQEWLAQLGYYQDGGHSDAQDWERLHATWRAMSATPNLISELKRMYEREDFLMKAREIWLIEERRLEKQVEVYREKMLQSVGRTSDIEKDLRKALRIIRDDLDDALEVYPTINQEDIVKVRNFANDASQ